MYRVCSILIILILLISPVLMSKSADFSSQMNQLLSSLFSDLEVKELYTYVVQVDKEELYLDKGEEANFSVGDQLLVGRTMNLLTDPITQESLGRITKPLAEISITKVEKDYSLAQRGEKLSSEKIKRGDKVINPKDKITILLAEFHSADKLSELRNNIEDKFYSYLSRKKLFKVNSMNISNYEGLNTNDNKGDYLVTGEVYEGGRKVFLKVELYDLQTGLTRVEKVVSFNKKDEIINYYRKKYKNQHSGYKLLFKTDDFSGPNHNLAWGDLDYGSLLVNQGSSLWIMDYEEELTSEYTIEDYNRTKYDDYNLVLGNIDGEEGLEIFAENYNYPLQFKKSKDGYSSKLLRNFYRNRPKLITSLQEKKYLITRDYKGFLKFNRLAEDKFITDFKIKIKKNEGYRLAVADIDGNQAEELIMNSYQQEQGYRLKIYDLNYNLKEEINKILGPEFVAANLNGDQKSELYSYSKKNNRVLAFEHQGDNYEKIWQSKELNENIIDLISGDINQDGQEELLVLVNQEQQSRIYVYQYQTAQW